MSTQVDERVVSMKFDNKQFEQNTATSMSTLDRLKKGLNLEGASKGLEGINAAAKNVSFDGISSGVEAISVKFSALQVMAITVLTNITNSAFNAGKNLVKSLTIDPVMAGFDSYETKINAIKTVMSGTGETLDQVTKSLNDLNNYSDKTVYSFQDMTENISKFTNAGLSSAQAATAIKGISNVAALAGANAGEASRAMYNFGQALSQGSVKLMDWKSIENANMATVGFKTQLLEAAFAAGTLKKSVDGLYVTAKGSVISATKGFNESLEEQWMTTNVLNATLADYASETTDIGKKANAAAQDVNTFSQMLDTMKDSVKTGWTKSWEAIIGTKDQARTLFTGINNAFGSIVGPSIVARNAMLSFWNQNGGRQAIIDALGNSFKVLSQILGAIGKAFHDAIPPATFQEIVNFSKGIRDLTKGFIMNADTVSNLELTFEGFFSLVGVGIKLVVFALNVFKTIIQALFPATESLSGGFLAITARIGVFFGLINEGLSNSTLFKDALKGISTAVGFLRSMYMPLIDALVNFIKTSTLVEDVINKIVEVFSPYINALKTFIQTSTFFEDATDSIKVALTNLVPSITNLISNIKGIDFNGATGASDKFHTSLIFLSSAGDKVKASFSGTGDVISKIKGMFETVGNAIKSIFGPALSSLIDKFKELKLSDIGGILAGGGILVLAKSFKDAIGSVKKVTSGFSEIVEGITGSLDAFQKKLKAEAILKIAIAIGILALSVVALSMIPTEALYKALGALTVICVELSLGMMVLQKASSSSPGLSVKLIALGVAILFIATAVLKLSSIDSGKMAVGVQGLASILTTLAIFIKVTSGTAGVQSSVLGLIGIAVAVLILCDAVKKFGEIDPKVMDKGIQGVVSALLVLGIFIKVIGSPEHMIAVGIGLTLMSASLILFAGAIGIYALMPIGILAKGMIAIAIALAILGVAAVAMSNPGVLAGSAAILVLVIALGMLVPVIAILGNLPIKVIGIALLALAGIFVVLGLAGLILAPLAPVILTLAAAIGLIGVGVFLLGGGLLLFSAGLAALTVSSAAFVAAFVAGVITLLKLIPTIANLVGAGIIALANAIVAAMPSVVAAVIAIETGLIAAFDALIIPVVQAAVKFILTLLVEIAKYIVPMVTAGLQLVLGFVNGMINNMPQIIATAVKFMLVFLNGIKSQIPAVINAAVGIVLTFVASIGSKIYMIVDSALQFILAFINGLANAIRNNTPAITAACRNLITAIIGAIASMYGMLFDVGGNIIKGVISGIKSMAGALVDAALSVVSMLPTAVKKFLGIKSPSRVFAEIGRYTGQGLVNGLVSFKSKVADSATDLGASAVNAMSNAIAGISDIVNDNIDTNLMDGVNGYAIAGSVNLANNTARDIQANKQSTNTDTQTVVSNPITPDPSFSNVFNIKSNDPKGVADEVSRIIQKQIERRKSAWA